MRKWINILTESVAESITDPLPEQPTKKTYTVHISGNAKFSMEDYNALIELVDLLKKDQQNLDIEIRERNVPADTTYESAMTETIRKVSGGYRLVSKKGKNLGTYPTKAGAEKRERQVQYFKHANEDQGELVEIAWLDEGLRKQFHSIIDNQDKNVIAELKCWPGYRRVKGKKPGSPGSCTKK